MSNKKKKGIYEKYIKRFLDIFFSGFALIVLSPIIGITALLIRVKLGSPIIFKQARPGKNEEIFYLYKFRSMTNEVDEDGKLLPDSKRLTKFGKILRKTSIDELPELINIIKGDMSIVGPRPLSIYYLPFYSEETKRRHSVRPGLTGLAQISGRNTISWDKRFELDVTYVDNITFINDIKIIYNTVFKVIKGADIQVRGTTKVCDFGTYKKIQEEGKNVVNHYDMTYSEIGSYFWLDEKMIPDQFRDILFLPKVSDSAFTFSGRTAIEIALRDILKKKNIKKVYVPGYSCVSMLQSFIDNDISYDFYDVQIKNGKVHYEIDPNKECDIFLFMKYFSIDSENLEETISKMKAKGAVIIEDITHSLLDKEVYFSQSDYLVASLRKWFEIPTGGWVGKIKGNLEVIPNIESNSTVLEKIKGMDMKHQFLMGGKVSKEEFLQINSKFDNELIHVDRFLKIDDTSLKILGNTDITMVKERRCRNAKILMETLKDIELITLPKIDFEKASPLFYPVFLRTEDRDSLRSYMIKEGIYCPIHWPEVMGAKKGIRANELSLICDQRYNEKDMYAISKCIHDWYENR